jgi:HAD superfamily hydrolase (TIGR01509 family)
MDERGSDDAVGRRIDVVLFDLHNTTLDGHYAGVGLRHAGGLMAERWGVDGTTIPQRFMDAMRHVMPTYLDRDFYLMRDVMADSFRVVTQELGIDATDEELAALDREMWRANIPAARPVDGAIETFDAIRATDRAVGIVSFADDEVFEALIDRLGFADHVDLAICSETARSCKPHPGIFRAALAAVGAAPERSVFVGDSIDADVVGGNRLGMTTVLVQGTEYSNDVGAFGDDPVTRPDHRIGSLPELIGLLG